ncbi:MAG: discoidin domain-containing protein, partial [Phycisphaeraceae bacterium]|nr:discoidin domain-containing protein [Phycisphaeraceae bacterium]
MHRMNVTSLLRLSMAVILCLLTVMTQQVDAARVEVAEELLVDLRAEDLVSGTVTEWPNRGSLGGVFTAVGTPVVGAVGDWDGAVSLDGDSYFVGPDSSPGIDGPNPTRSIEIWAYKIGINGEQTMVHWGTRGGPDGTNMAFNYGNNGSFGAVGHWGGADLGWGGAHAPNPALESWWHLVYTHDGTTTRLYVNGDPAGEEATNLNTDRASPIRVGAQSDNSGAGIEAGFNFVGAIAQVRIHDGVLTPEQIRTNSLIRIQTAETASNPSPADDDIDVLRNTALSWQPGETAQTRHLYLGTVFDDVNSATVPTALDLADTSFDPGRLDFGQLYYWRVDEVNGTPDKTVFKGDVWSFTAEPYSVQIPGATIVASASTSMAVSGPEKTIDGSGLDPMTGQHSTNNTEMWFSLAADMSPWLQYEFEEVKQLDKILLWNSNSMAESAIGWGLKEVVIETSVDGADWTVLEGANQFSRAPGTADYAEPDEVLFGDVSAKAVKITILSNHGGVLPAYGASEVQFFEVPVKARTPYPADLATEVMPNVVATWRAGRGADTHRVLVSQDASAISEGLSAISNTNSIDMATLDLQLGETYYWQVIEANENNVPSEWAGDVWRLTTVNRVVVDDFESYSNLSPDRPFQTWVDGIGYSADEFFSVGYDGNGSGAAVGHDIWSLSSPHYQGDIMEQVLTAEASGQSMPIYYSGNAHTDRTFETAQDWSIAGITTLVMHFNGDRANDAGTLYITINGTRVDYPKASALSSGVWTQWNVDLASVGVNL